MAGAPVDTELISTSSSLILQYSTGFSPALRTVKRLLKCFTLQHAEVVSRFIHPFCKTKVLDIRFTGASAAASMGRAAVRHSPSPGNNIDFALVLLILSFPFEVAYFIEHVDCHNICVCAVF